MVVEKIVLRVRHRSEPRSKDEDWIKQIQKLATIDGKTPVVFARRSTAADFKDKYEASHPGWTAYMDISQKDVGGDPPHVIMSNEELDALLFGPEAVPTFESTDGHASESVAVPTSESVAENF